MQALAERLDDDGEVGVPAGDLEQVAAAEPLQPQRRPLAGSGRGISSARAAFCRKRSANRALSASSSSISPSTFSASGPRTGRGRLVACVRRIRMPSSWWRHCDREPELGRSRASSRQPQRQVQLAAGLSEHRQADCAGRATPRSPASGRRPAPRPTWRGTWSRRLGRRRGRGRTRPGASPAGRVVEAAGQLAAERADGEAEVVGAAVPSPRQNGTIAGSPSAGDEHAVGLDRSSRQAVVPSRNVSPTRRS